MRILIVANYAPPHIGGVEVLVDREARLLAAAGHKVRLVTSACGDGAAFDYPEAIQVERITAWNVLERRCQIPWPIYSIHLMPALVRAVHWCDIAHVHGFLGLNSLITILLTRLMRRGRRCILTEHAGRIWYCRFWKRWLQRIAIETLGRLNVRLADRSFVCHGNVLQLLARLAGKRQKIGFLMFPPDRALFRPPTDAERSAARSELGWPPQRGKVLFVGRLSARKGVDLLLKAQSERYDLVFVGPGDVSLLHDGGRCRVEYFGPLTQQELVKLYYAADVLAVPSRSEGNLVLVAQEALACGLPVLLGDDSGLAHFRDCPGVHFCNLAPSAIRSALQSLLDQGRPSIEPNSNPLNGYVPTEKEWIDQTLSGGNGASVPYSRTQESHELFFRSDR